jgi:hypothetical protein
MISETNFSYTFSDGVHRVATLHKTGDAVKAVLAHMERVLDGLPADEKVRVLVDFCPSGMPPIAESVTHLLDFFRRQGHKAKQASRIAYLYPLAAQSRILTGFLGIQRFLPQRVSVRFFPENEEEKALEWLQVG